MADNSTRRWPVVGWAAAAFAALAVMIAQIPVINAPLTSLFEAGAYYDDSFFYSVIAERVAQGGMVSLDGIHPTNGFQPLWMAILILLNLLLPSASAYGVVLWAGFVLAAAAAALFAGYLMTGAPQDTPEGPTLTSANKGVAAALGTLMFLGLSFLHAPFLARVVNGLETTLLMTMLPLWLIAGRAALAPRAGLGASLWFTAASAALFLTRTDLFWAPMLATGVILLRHGFGRVLIASLALSSLMILPYLGWNTVEFGSPMPISGRVKAFYLEEFLPTSAAYWASDEWRGFPSLFQEIYGIGMVPLALILGSIVLALTARPLRIHMPRELWLLVILCIAHLTYMQLIYRELRPYTNYYFLPELTLILLLLAHMLRSILLRIQPELASARMGALAMIAALLVAIPVLRPRPAPPPHPFWVQAVALSDDIQRVVPDQQAVGAFWPGLFAGITDHPIVPLDGIISSPDYFTDVLQQRRELAYAADIGVEYLAVYFPPGMGDGSTEMQAPDWAQLYLERMQDAKDLTFEEILRRPIGPAGESWRLLRLGRAPG